MSRLTPTTAPELQAEPPATQVAVGVVIDNQGRILVAKRPKTVHQGGRWEFPGGKMKPTETPEQALIRELQEEIGITPTASTPWMQIHHAYDDKTVLLHVWQVTAWAGRARGREGQPIAWHRPSALNRLEFPAANASIVAAIQQQRGDGHQNDDQTHDPFPTGLLLGGAGLLLTALAASYWLAETPLATAQNLTCDAALTPCRVTGEGWQLALRLGDSADDPITTPLTTLQPFPVTLELSGDDTVDRVGLFFWMADMDMGPNRTRLVQQSAGQWTGTAMLPLCTESRDDWRVTVTAMAGDDVRYRADFAFTARRR